MTAAVSAARDTSCNCCGAAAAFLVRNDDRRLEYLCARCAQSGALFNGATEQLEQMIESAVSTAIQNWETTWAGKDFADMAPTLMSHIMIDLAAQYGAL